MPSNKGMILYEVWLTKEEEKIILEVLGDGNYEKRLGALINRINKRGDFNKKWK